MNTQHSIIRKTSALALTALCAAAFTGCLTMPEENRDDGLARMVVEVTPGAVSPTRDLPLKEMTVTLTSSAGDTLRDTITDGGSLLSTFPVRLNAPDGSRIINPIYAVDPAKDWTVSVKTLDDRDSVVHAGTARAGTLAAGVLSTVAMPLAARFASYEAVFALPAAAAAEGARLQRVEASVDGAAACAADAQNGDAAKLTCDALPVGARVVTLSVYGQAAGSAATQLLFKGAANVDITAGDAPTESVELSAADQSLGDVGMKVRLGRVGRVTMNVVMSGALDI